MAHQSAQGITSEPPNLVDPLASSLLQLPEDMVFAGSYHICYGSVLNIVTELSVICVNGIVQAAGRD